VKVAKCFLVWANEKSDVTSKEQLILDICFYDNDQTEEFFFVCFGIENVLTGTVFGK